MILLKSFILPSYLMGGNCVIMVKKWSPDEYEHVASYKPDSFYTIAVWHVRAK